MRALALCLFLWLHCSFAAWAQTRPNESGAIDLPLDQTMSTPESAANNSGAYVSGVLGDGAAYGGNTSGDRGMKWKGLELRFGKDIDPAVFGAVSLFSAMGKIRVDFVYYNEGHPDNNHRDGFSTQLVYSNALRNGLSAEVGIGPYLSMNTTEIGGVQINDSNLGALFSLALWIALDQYSQGLYLRVALNHVAIRDVHSSNALLVGIGKYFREVPAHAEPGSSRNPLWIGAAAGNSVTNQAGTDGALGFSLEARQYRGSWAASIAAIVEGDDGSRVDQRGIAAQGWFVQPLTGKWAVSAGVGPYVAKNERESGHPRLLGLFTLQADRSISKTMKVFASFSRVITFRERNDRDLFRIGVMKQLGG